MLLENKKQLKILRQYATKQEVEKIVEDSADDVMRSCAVQFASIDAQFLTVNKSFVEVNKRFTEVNKRFDHLEERLDHIKATMVTKTDLDTLYRGMIDRFESADRHFEKLEEKTDKIIEKMDTFIVFMKGQDKRITRIEKHLSFA